MGLISKPNVTRKKSVNKPKILVPQQSLKDWGSKKTFIVKKSNVQALKHRVSKWYPTHRGKIEATFSIEKTSSKDLPIESWKLRSFKSEPAKIR